MPKRPAVGGRRPRFFPLSLAYLVAVFSVALMVAATGQAAAAQEGDPDVVVLDIDERHLLPYVSWGGGGGVPSGAGCAEVFLAGQLPKRSGYQLSYEHRIEVSIDLGTGQSGGTLTGEETIQGTTGAATCSWQGSFGDQAEVSTPDSVYEPWEVTVPGEVHVQCSGQSRCSIKGTEQVVDWTVDEAFSINLWVHAKAGGQILRMGVHSDPELPLDAYRLTMRHPAEAPFPEVVFPAMPPEQASTVEPESREGTPTEVSVTVTTPADSPDAAPTPVVTRVVLDPEQVIDDLREELAGFLSGGEASAPTAGRAAAAAVASGSLVAVWAAVHTLSGRRTTEPALAIEANGTLAPAETDQGADLRQYRARWRKRLMERAHKVIVLEDIERDLKNNVVRLYRQWELERQAGFTDGLLDLVDLEVSILGAAYGGSSALATALSRTPFKDTTKIAVRNHMARRIGATPLDPGQVLEGVWDSATGSGGLPKLVVMNSAKSAGGIAAVLGRAYGPGESAASMARTFLKNKARVAALRNAFNEAYADWLRIRRDLEDARAAAAEARSAVESADAAVRELQAQFPHRFRDL